MPLTQQMLGPFVFVIQMCQVGLSLRVHVLRGFQMSTGIGMLQLDLCDVPSKVNTACNTHTKLLQFNVDGAVAKWWCDMC